MSSVAVAPRPPLFNIAMQDLRVASPAPATARSVAAAEAVETGAGVLFIVKNYAGDVMNFALAAEMCGGSADTLVIDDDVALNRSTQGRRGVAGTMVVEKMLGAAAEAGA